MKTATVKQLEEFENAVWTEFLNEATNEQIHQSVMTANWDGNSFLLNWIKDNPKVDKATILLAYWKTAPRWHKQYFDREDCLTKCSWNIASFDFVEEIEQKYCNGFFTESNIELNPAKDHDGENWTADYLDKTVVREIPQIMFQKLEGKTIADAHNFDDGLPFHYAQRIFDFMHEYEIVADQ